MITDEQWEAILTASTSSEAVSRALRYSLSDLCESPLPLPYEKMSERSQSNARVISRAFDITLDDVPAGGWSKWTHSEEDIALARLWDDQISLHRIHADLGQVEGEDKTVLTKTKTTAVHELAMIPHDNSRVSMKKPKSNITPESRAIDIPRPAPAQQAPTVEELKAAETIRIWAQQYSHREAPRQAVSVVAKSPCTTQLLKTIVSSNASSTLRGTVIVAFSENGGSSVATALVTTLIVPYLNALKAPASRELMHATVKFAEVHWRPSLRLFQGYDSSKRRLNSPVAEVLVRVCGVLSGEGALRALSLFGQSHWGENGIRVVEALLGKCKESKEVEPILIAALQRNVVGLERSVRFGKLLFTVVTRFPDLSQENRHALMSISERSSAFLAKRAVTVLRQRLTKPI